ncbi:MAG: TAXI family TRAP transporter solute-binding subunit [Proteobacteria bacterium]|nr:TAXI family TRAP transporter solute-binding subunit [Pseudomonadota bacterium]
MSRGAKIAGLLVAVLAVSIFLRGPQEYNTLELTAGQLGGGWYTMASGMAKIIMERYPDVTIKVVPGGAVTNPSKVEIGKSQLGFGLDVFTLLAYQGREVYSKRGAHEKVMMIGMSLSDTYLHFIRAADAELGFEEIFTTGRDQNIGITKVGSSDEQTVRWIMAHYGTDHDDLREQRGYKINLGNYSELSGQFKDRQIDYAFINLGLPGAAVIDMTLGRDADVLSLPDVILNAMQEKYGFLTGIIPAGTYDRQTDDVLTLKYATVLLVSADVDADTVYKITSALCADQDKLRNIHASMAGYSCETATVNAPVPIHPGAERYYAEQH